MLKTKLLIIALSLSVAYGFNISVDESNPVANSIKSFANQTMEFNLPVILPEYEEVAVKETPPEKLEVIEEVNNDAIGWINVSGTSIDYPIMYKDNDSYLYHSYNGDYNFNGSIFLDETVAPDLQTGVVLLHGHNMLDGTMFGAIPRIHAGVISKDNVVEIFDGNEIRTYNILGSFYYSVAHRLVETQFASHEYYKEYLQELAGLCGATIDPSYENEVIVMSTCAEATGPGRVAVVAIRA